MTTAVPVWEALVTTAVGSALDKLLVGQESPKISLTRLIDMHQSWFGSRDFLHRAPNALVIGPTGTGKSHALTVAAQALKLPLVIVDSTRLVAAVATEQLTFEDIIVQLVQNARKLTRESGDVEHNAEFSAEQGIVFLDEFDKLATKDPSSASAAIQRRLLQFIEGETVFISSSERSDARSVDTHGILFIASGAFSGIQALSVIAERRQSTSRNPEVGDTIQAQDVVEFGFLHELVARLPVIIRFKSLSREELGAILDHPDVSPLNFYKQYFLSKGLNVSIPEDTRELICEEAVGTALGARGIHQTLFPILSALADELSDDGRVDSNAVVDYALNLGEYARLRAKAYR